MQIDLHNVDRVWMNQCAKMSKPKVISLEVRRQRSFHWKLDIPAVLLVDG